MSNEQGRSGDLAIIKKKAHDEGTAGFCIALCSPVDTYDLTFKPEVGLTPTQKASVIAEAVNHDYLYFENEQPLCYYNPESKNIEILLCNAYCYGCLCPCKAIIPTKDDG